MKNTGVRLNRISQFKSDSPSIEKLRSFGAIWIVVFAALLVAGLYRGDSGGVLFWLKGAALATGVVGIGFPSILRFLYIAMTTVTAPIGWLVSRCVLAVIYFGILTPIGLALRLTGRDPLARHFVNSADSYWSPVTDSQDEESCFRQY